MKINNNRGIALIFTLFFVTNLLILEVAFVSRTLNGAGMVRLEREGSKTLYAAQGGAQVALQMIDTLINGYLQTTISKADPSGVVTDAKIRVTNADGIGWLVNGTRNNNVPVLSQNVDEATYSNSGTIGTTPYSYTITFAQKSAPTSPSTDKWDFPFVFRIVSAGTSGTLGSQTVVSGDFTVRVQKDNFAKFALFTNDQNAPNGTQVWFTNRTLFYGPVHTNDRLNFALNPSGKFNDVVTQVQQTARFNNNDSPVLIDGNANGTTDVPTFQSGFTRNVAQVTLSAATAETDMITATKGSYDCSSSTICLPNSSGTLTGGIYLSSDSTIALSVDSSDRAVYTITSGSKTRVITVDRTANSGAGSTTVLKPSDGSSVAYTGIPKGTSGAGTIIYVAGGISSLSGTVQKDTEITIASHDDTVITNNLRYASYTADTGTPGQTGYVPPTADGATNLLGLVSWAGNVRIGSAPDDIDIHATIMAMSGVFSVDNYNNGDVRGVATLLGGVITNHYGAFGQFNTSTGLPSSGYGRNFIYDERMKHGSAPPYFPSLKTFTAFTNGITDKLVWQEMQ